MANNGRMKTKGDGANSKKGNSSLMDQFVIFIIRFQHLSDWDMMHLNKLWLLYYAVILGSV